MYKFKTRKSLAAKFFYPWETITDSMTREEMIELIWNSGDYQQRIAAILKRMWSVRDWDWEDDGDDYIEVFFKDSTDSDQLAHDIEDINRQFSNEWDKLLRNAMENVAEYRQDEQEDIEGGWDANKPLVEPPSFPNNVWDTKESDEWDTSKPTPSRIQSLGRQHRMGMDNAREDAWDTKSHKPADRLKVWNR